MQNKSGLLSNLMWKFAERFSAQIVSLVVSIILARLLEPTHYGTIALVNVFIQLANVFVANGFGSALIQKKDADELDFSSVLYFNIIFACILYLVLFFAAPSVSQFYGEGYEILTPVLRVLSLRLILSAINSVQQAYVSRNMMFKKFFWATLFGTIVSAVVGITMAYCGFGVWALVAQYMTNTTVDTFVLFLSLKVHPIRAFSATRLKNLVGYGLRVLITNLLIQGYQELRAMIIGKVYSSEELAYYDKGKQFPSLLVTNVDASISAVLFPRLSQLQDDPTNLKNTTRMSIRFSSYIMCPLMLGLAAISENFVRIVLTEKWLPCVPLLQLLCITYMCMPLHSANMQAIKAMGRSDITLKVEIIKKAIELIVLIITMWYSVEVIVLGMLICSIAFVFINSFPNIKLINYTIREQLSDLLPSITMSVVMYLSVIGVGILQIPLIPLFILQIAAGTLTYICLSVVTKNTEFCYILRYFLSIINHK